MPERAQKGVSDTEYAESSVSDAHSVMYNTAEAESSAQVSYFVGEKRVDVPVVSWHIDPERPIIDHSIFGPNSMTYYINYAYDEDGHFYRNWKTSFEFIVSLSEREKYFFRRWQRRAKPTWRKPQRMAYPSGRHKNRRR